MLDSAEGENESDAPWSLGERGTAAAGGTAGPNRPPLEARRLRCEYQVDPIGLGELRPRLSWEPVGDGRCRRQTAYRVRVASTRQALGRAAPDVWDSGKRQSSATFGVTYEGPALASGCRYHWSVELWDEEGDPSAVEERAFWEMGLLEPGAWEARWIGINDGAFPGVEAPGSGGVQGYEVGRSIEPCTYVRREVVVDAPIRRARAYATARGLYELHANGSVVGDKVLRPGWTDYDQRIQVQTHDVTPYLREGRNCVGAVLGDGWFAGYVGFMPKRRGFMNGHRSSFLAQIQVELDDGRTLVVGSDTSWTSSFGDWIYADLLMGRSSRARRRRVDPRGRRRTGGRYLRR